MRTRKLNLPKVRLNRLKEVSDWFQTCFQPGFHAFFFRFPAAVSDFQIGFQRNPET